MLEFSAFLTRIGLTDKEAAVYEHLLESGERSVARISAATKLKRGDLYNILYSLRDRGLVEQADDAAVARFRLTDPDSLRHQLAAQQSRLEEAALAAEAFMPKITSRYALTQSKPAVHYAEGLAGWESVYKELFASGTKEFLLLRSVYDIHDPTMHEALERIKERQVALGITMRIIAPLEENSRRRLTVSDPQRGIERRIVEPDRLRLPGQIMIWKDTVAIASLRGAVVSMIIDNKDIADSFRAIFEYVWEKAGPYHEELAREWAKAD